MDCGGGDFAVKRTTKWALRLVAAVVLAVPMWWMTLGIFMALPYGASMWTAAWLMEAKPPRATADRRLWYCTSRPIEAKDSWWGCHYELKDGERFIQYRVFGLEEWPIDVVYGPDGDSRTVFESYE